MSVFAWQLNVCLLHFASAFAGGEGGRSVLSRYGWGKGRMGLNNVAINSNPFREQSYGIPSWWKS
jgi:hypothetical protein